MKLLQDFMEDENEEELVRAFHEEMDEDERLEMVVILEKMLLFGPSSSMKRFAKTLLNRCSIPTNIKCRIAEMIYDADDPVYIEQIRKWIPEDDMEIACRVEWIRRISVYPHYTTSDQVQDWIQYVFCHGTVSRDPFFRFRVITDASHSRLEVFVAIMKVYKKLFTDPVMYRVALAQLMMKKDTDTPFAQGSEEMSFLTMCLDDLAHVLSDNDKYTPEEKADVCDFFLDDHHNQERTSEYRKLAEQTMHTLFQEDMTSGLSIFTNRQNIHSGSIEKSSQDILEKLHEKYGLQPCGFGDVYTWREQMEGWDAWKQLSSSNQDKITIAVNRILFDKKLYGKTGDTLSTIFGLVWRHIHCSTHKEELQLRFLDELMDASGQCSSGIAVRMLNTLSGFDDFMLKISYREAILSQVLNHMNKKIKHMEGELRERLLDEMLNPNSSYTDRKGFLELFRKEIPVIKEVLYEEYRGLVSDTDFDLYLKQALVHYEGY